MKNEKNAMYIKGRLNSLQEHVSYICDTEEENKINNMIESIKEDLE